MITITLELDEEEAMVVGTACNLVADQLSRLHGMEKEVKRLLDVRKRIPKMLAEAYEAAKLN